MSRIFNLKDVQRVLPTCVTSPCGVYLALTMDSALLVREFPNLFSEDLLGLPADRELEFGI